MATKISAPRRGWPTRDRALLIADPSPEWLAGIEPISVLVTWQVDQQEHRMLILQRGAQERCAVPPAGRVRLWMTVPVTDVAE